MQRAFPPFTYSLIQHNTQHSSYKNQLNSSSMPIQFLTFYLVYHQFSLFPSYSCCKSQFIVALQDMCPLRFILIFFSAVLAAYFAWTTVSSSPEIDITIHDHKNKENVSFKKMIQNGVWVVIDMASGKYLWRNLKSLNDDVEVKSS